MKKETLEQAAKQWAYDWGNDSGYNSRTDDLEDGFIAGASWREQQASQDFEEYWSDGDSHNLYMLEATYKNYCKIVWQASQLSSAKLLAEKDAEIKMLRDLSVKSCVCLKLSDELFKAKELIKEMQDALKFYATESNWRDIVAEEAINDRHGLSEGCFDSIIYEDCENDIGGKLARKTLKENAEKIKALLGEE